MKKIFFFFISVLAISFCAHSQDIIIKKSGEEIKAKVIEIGITEIKYKRFDFQDGPLYSIGKSDVLVVRYENGTNEVISTTPTTPTPTNPPVVTTPVAPPQKVSNKIENGMGSYTQGGRYISKTRVIATLKATNDPEIVKMLRKSNNRKATGTIVSMALGLPLIIVGTLTTIRGAVMMQGSTTDYYYQDTVDPDAKGITTVGAFMAGTGVTLQAIGLAYYVKSNNLIEDAVVIYNNKYADK